MLCESISVFISFLQEKAWTLFTCTSNMRDMGCYKFNKESQISTYRARRTQSISQIVPVIKTSEGCGQYQMREHAAPRHWQKH